MGQKTNPVGFRLGVIRTWDSNWFDQKNFPSKLSEDLMLRKYVMRRLARASVSKIEIERTAKQITLAIHTAKPGIVIGRKGTEVDKLREELQRLTGTMCRSTSTRSSVPAGCGLGSRKYCQPAGRQGQLQAGDEKSHHVCDAYGS